MFRLLVSSFGNDMKVTFIDNISMENRWFDYVSRVYEDLDVSTAQYHETRLAFYAGAWAALNRMIKLAEQDESTALKSMTVLLEEIGEFLKENVGYKPQVERNDDEGCESQTSS